MEKGVLGLLRAQNDLNHYSQWYEDLLFHFFLTVPCVCYHFLPSTVSIITKLAGRLYNFS